MKTAISVDGTLLQEADRTAREIGVSRSGLFSLALKAYLEERHRQRITEQLNRVYAAEPDPAAARTVRRMKAKFRSTIQDRW